MKVLIANRGEIANRIDRAAQSLGWETQRIHVAEESSHAPEGSILLPQSGVAGYLDIEAIIDIAVESGSSMIHPGYGFLSENAAFARACEAAGIIFVGPTVDSLELFGDKANAREFSSSQNVPVLPATPRGASPEDVEKLLTASPDGVMIKAVAGGGGRGIRRVTDPSELHRAFNACRNEAQLAFGNDELYAERILNHAKHVEIQVIGDGTGEIVTLGERECSVQRRHQKLLEVAPSPSLTKPQRESLYQWARQIAAAAAYRGLGTVEFLVTNDALGDTFEAFFMEMNPRLQVEHTVTEEISGVDLVATQMLIAAGRKLPELPLPENFYPAPNLWSIQARVAAEKLVDGAIIPATGQVTALEFPATARIENGLAEGQAVDGTFDSLIAKIITTTSGTFEDACREAADALNHTRIEGLATNTEFLSSLLHESDFVAGQVTTRWLDDLLAQSQAAARPQEVGEVELRSPMSGVVTEVPASAGTAISASDVILRIEAMKMEHAVQASGNGTVLDIFVAPGDRLDQGDLIAKISYTSFAVASDATGPAFDLEHIRPDLAELHERIARTRDESRPEAVEKRHSRGHLTAREWVDNLIDADSFVEYGTLPVAAQRSRRDIEDLISRTPADGMVTGFATIDGADVAVLAYDYTVLAGTQGYFNHQKTDRVLRVAVQKGVPVIFFAEGGGGRPGDTDTANLIAAGLQGATFSIMASVSGKVPLIGIVTGKCFAGNAALLSCCDVIIATEDSNIGMAGPAMIEGGGLGKFTPEEIGPASVQGPNGVVDLVVKDDHEAIASAKQYLSYFQDTTPDWSAQDQRVLRHLIPENRKHVYNVREVVESMSDTDSVLELRKAFGLGAITALSRIEGRPVGIVANNPTHLGGAIDSDAADKISRFMQLCSAHGIPIITLCDTPGFMVGPAAEETATVRHFGRMFLIGANLRVPLITVILRKAYGLGAQAMAGGSFHTPLATIAWPTGEVGGMGLEGAVTLGFSKELEAISDPQARASRYQELVDMHYQTGRSINAAMKFEFDEVIDPIHTRPWILATIRNWVPPVEDRTRFIDAW